MFISWSSFTDVHIIELCCCIIRNGRCQNLNICFTKILTRFEKNLAQIFLGGPSTRIVKFVPICYKTCPQGWLKCHVFLYKSICPIYIIIWHIYSLYELLKYNSLFSDQSVIQRLQRWAARWP